MKLTPIASNMTQIESGPVTVLFSYKTPVAAHIEGQGYYRTEHKWSSTTSRHINKWLIANGARDPKTVPQPFFDTLLQVNA